jgi:hypothetical protein
MMKEKIDGEKLVEGNSFRKFSALPVINFIRLFPAWKKN